MTKIASDFAILSDVVKYEDAQHKMYGRNRSNVTFNGLAATLEVGTVLGKVTAGGKYKVLTPASSDGAQNAAAIVTSKVTVLAATDTDLMVLGGDLAYQVELGVLASALLYPAGITAPQIAAAEAALGAKGFQIVKEYV